jgi:EAL domain-containing protein (putative c-di-GMP-specific phosphodiesterase class I)
LKNLSVYYQPKYDIQANPPKLKSAEALIRWDHPELGMISPGAFIPLFEGNGLISLVDRYVWEETAKQVAIWKEKYNYTLPVSVNLSRPVPADEFEKLIKNELNITD